MDDTQSDQAGPNASNGDVVKGDEAEFNGSMDSEQIESDRVQTHLPFFTGQSKLSKAVSKRSTGIPGPSVNRIER